MSSRPQQAVARLPALSSLRERVLVNPDPAARRLADRGLWVVGAALIVVGALFPLFAEVGDLLLAQQALYIGLLALSLNLLVNTTGLVSFGHAMFFGFGAYLVAIPFARLDWSPLLGLALTPLIGAVSAFIIGLVVLRGAELYFALLTLGASQLVWATAHGWQSLTGGTNGITGVFGPEFLLPFVNPNNVYWFVFGIVVLCALILYIITQSPFGDALRGIRENKRRAEFVGLPVKRYELAAFVIAGTFGAVAGGLSVISETQIASPQIEWTRSALALVVCLIGGVRYFLGPIAGAMFYMFVFDWVIGRTVMWDTVLGIVVLAVALALTGGLVGLVHASIAQAAAIVKRNRTGEPKGGPAEDQTAAHVPALAELDPAPSRGGSEDPPVALEVGGVTKRFDGLVAVDDVSLSVREGTIHAIIGPNGAGKTTLFNVITGLAKPTSGTVTLDGQDVTGWAPWKLVRLGVSRSFQQTNLFWSLPCATNVTLAAAAARAATWRPFGRHKASARDRASDLLSRVGLSRFADVPANELSHGDQRSLEIAIVLAAESKFVLLDEPTAGLSPTETKAAVALIKSIAAEQDLTVLFVEHDMDVVFGIADVITVLHQGAVLAGGSPDEIRENVEVQRAYLGDPPEATETAP